MFFPWPPCFRSFTNVRPQIVRKSLRDASFSPLAIQSVSVLPSPSARNDLASRKKRVCQYFDKTSGVNIQIYVRTNILNTCAVKFLFYYKKKFVRFAIWCKIFVRLPIWFMLIFTRDLQLNTPWIEFICLIILFGNYFILEVYCQLWYTYLHVHIVYLSVSHGYLNEIYGNV